jgi:flagellar biosynthesis/type III secretory pathway protein FliH
MSLQLGESLRATRDLLSQRVESVKEIREGLVRLYAGGDGLSEGVKAGFEIAFAESQRLEKMTEALVVAIDGYQDLNAEVVRLGKAVASHIITEEKEGQQ